MKVLILSILIISSTSFARESLFKAEPPIEQASEALNTTEVSRAPVNVPSRDSKPLPEGNLSFRLREARLIGGEAGIVSAKSLGLKHPKLRPGMSLVVELEHPVLAFLDGKTPVVAKVLTKGFQNFKLIGEASLEKNSKHIELKFDRLSNQKENQVFETKVQTMVEGEYHTNSNKIFLAEFLSSFAAALVDASIQRDQSLLGPYVDRPSLEASGKKAGANALGKVSEKFRERVNQAGEYTTLTPAIIETLVLE